MAALGFLPKLVRDDVHKRGARIVVALVEPGVEFDEYVLAGAVFLLTRRDRRSGQLDHRRLADAPGTRNSDGDGAAARLDDDFRDRIGDAGKVQKIAFGFVIGPHLQFPPKRRPFFGFGEGSEAAADDRLHAEGQRRLNLHGRDLWVSLYQGTNENAKIALRRARGWDTPDRND
jgi:hypothetical protein